MQSSQKHFQYIELYEAIKRGNLAKVTSLLSKGLDINYQSAENAEDTPLMAAVDAEKLNIANYLLKQGASVDIQSSDGHTPLSLAVHRENDQMAILLLENGAKLQQAYKDGAHPLEVAVRSGNEKMVSWLLSLLASPKHAYKFDLKMLLSIALEINKKKIVINLLATDRVYQNTSDESKKAILKHFARTLSFEKYIIIYCSFNEINHYETSTQLRTMSNYISDLLLQGFPNKYIIQALPAAFLNKNKLALASALQDTHYEFSIWLIQQNTQSLRSKNISVQHQLNEQLLHAAKHNKQIELHEAIELGADINHVNCLGNSTDTPLLRALKNLHTESAQILIHRGADITITDDCGDSALHIAAKTGNIVIARLLLERGAEADNENGVFETPLYLSARDGHADILKLLIAKSKANIHMTCFETRESLLTVATARSTEALHNVQNHVAKSPSENGYDLTPLAAAKLMNEDECAMLLISAAIWEKQNKVGRLSAKLSLFSTSHQHEDKQTENAMLRPGLE